MEETTEEKDGIVLRGLVGIIDLMPEKGEPMIVFESTHQSMEFVARLAGPIGVKDVGKLMLTYDGRIHGVEVHPDYRRQKFGRELVLAAMARAHDLGLNEVYLWVDSSDDGAQKFWGSLGFHPEVPPRGRVAQVGYLHMVGYPSANSTRVMRGEV